jgi:hypothetical protein
MESCPWASTIFWASLIPIDFLGVRFPATAKLTSWKLAPDLMGLTGALVSSGLA